MSFVLACFFDIQLRLTASLPLPIFSPRARRIPRAQLGLECHWALWAASRDSMHSEPSRPSNTRATACAADAVARMLVDPKVQETCAVLVAHVHPVATDIILHTTASELRHAEHHHMPRLHQPAGAHEDLPLLSPAQTRNLAQLETPLWS